MYWMWMEQKNQIGNQTNIFDNQNFELFNYCAFFHHFHKYSWLLPMCANNPFHSPESLYPVHPKHTRITNLGQRPVTIEESKVWTEVEKRVALFYCWCLLSSLRNSRCRSRPSAFSQSFWCVSSANLKPVILVLGQCRGKRLLTIHMTLPLLWVRLQAFRLSIIVAVNAFLFMFRYGRKLYGAS